MAGESRGAATDGKGGSGPYAGIRVIDITTNVLGPVATQLLGDLGADVIKIETRTGDQNRLNGPSRHVGMAPLFLTMNRNKRSVVLDLKDEKCRAALRKIVESADVFVHSMRPSAAERLGIGYEAISGINPNIIYANSPGFSGEGPRWDAPAFDDVIQGMSGLAWLNASAPDQPRYFPTVIADKFCGYALASAISTALFHRERTGEGQRVEVPMFETLLQFNYFEHLWEAALGKGKDGVGYVRMFSPNRRPYATQDGFICVLAVNDQQWRRLLSAIGRPEVLEEPRFRAMADRMKNISELYAVLSEELAKRSTAEWDEIFGAADVPHGPVNSLGDLLEDTYLNETGFFQEVDHPTEGKVLMTAIPTHFSKSPGGYRYPPPRLGEHTREVLSGLGMPDEAIEEILANAVPDF